VAVGPIITLGLNYTPSLIVTLGYGIGIADELIGRKYPRRGRSRPRKIVLEDLPKEIEKVSREKVILAEELSAAQATLVSVELMAHNKSVNRTEQIKALSGTIGTLEQKITIKREEEMLLMLSLMALEM